MYLYLYLLSLFLFFYAHFFNIFNINISFFSWFLILLDLNNVILKKHLDKAKLNYINCLLKKNTLYNYFNFIYSLSITLNKYIHKVKYTNEELVLILNIKQNNELLFVVNFFKKHYKYQFKELVDICTVDHYLRNIYTYDRRFDVNYLFLSLKYKLRLRLQVLCDVNTPITSIYSIFSSANWLERENWDMFGIFFINHIDLRRILTDYGFDGFPLRKDFPLNGYIELRYDDEKKMVVYELIELAQEFRFFEFINPWQWAIFDSAK